MSEYMTFVVRKGDVFTPIYTCTHSSEVFQDMKGAAEYGFLTEVHKDELVACIEHEKAYARDLEKDIEAIESNKRLVAGWDNSIEDKMEALSQYDLARQEIRDRIEEARITAVRLQFLYDIAEELEFFKDYTKKESGLYAGIEIPEDPSLEDIGK
ncbi:MAG: hypothetical protein II453_02570 [Alphaproteobacteria bacterium]|nr:hypothetical protein [Alphaproteobacteria bacterium]